MLNLIRLRKLCTITFIAAFAALTVFLPTQRTQAKELVGADSPSWSPSGKQIAYIIYRDQQPDLYVIDIDASTPIKLVENASQPSWSPDGKRIAYTSYSGDTFGVSIIDIASKRGTQFSNGYSPKWSPDGKRIAYLAGQQLFIANVEGSTAPAMITGPAMMVWDFVWSSDGKHLALSVQGNTDDITTFYVINPDGTGLRKLADSPYDTGMSWSPDGSQLVFVGNCAGQSTATICAANSDGSNLKALTDYRGALQPRWSPDGKQILFTNSSLSIVDVDGTHRHSLSAQDATTYDSQASWSPDGSHILFVRMHYPTGTDEAQYRIYFEVDIMNADGSNVHRLPDSLKTF